MYLYVKYNGVVNIELPAYLQVNDEFHISATLPLW